MLPPRSYVFIGLNIVRVLSIVALILVFSSSIFVMVNDVMAVNSFMSAAHSSGYSLDSLLENCDYIEDSTVPNQPAGVFWAVMNRLFIIFEVIVLLLSEFCWPAPFFERFCPVLGPSFGLGPLGIFQGLIGATILSQYVDDFPLVAAFFLFSIGCVNMLLGLVFRASARSRRSITEWRSENKNILPPVSRQQATFVTLSDTYRSSRTQKTFGSGVGRSTNAVGGGLGFGRRGEQAASLKGFLISKPLETLPRFAQPPGAPPPKRNSRSSTLSDATLIKRSPPEFESSPHAI